MISRHNHSGWALPASPQEDAESTADEAAFEGHGFMSDAGSVRTQWRAAPPRGYDAEFRTELQAEGGGLRLWYASFESIDWIHDAIKSALRMRKIRKRRREEGFRGWLVNMWDGSQGWVLVTMVGFFTACIAFCSASPSSTSHIAELPNSRDRFAVIRSEMLFFDLKDGCTLPRTATGDGEDGANFWFGQTALGACSCRNASAASPSSRPVRCSEKSGSPR